MPCRGRRRVHPSKENHKRVATGGRFKEKRRRPMGCKCVEGTAGPTAQLPCERGQENCCNQARRVQPLDKSQSYWLRALLKIVMRRDRAGVGLPVFHAMRWER
eukprot:4267687-Amphidinium_carterae.1